MLEMVFGKFIGLLGPIAALQKDKRALADDALRAVSQALTETNLYYRDVEAGHGPDRDREAQLVRAWAAAAIPVRHLDSELAQICELKAEYWVNPDNWDHSKIHRLGIDLESVTDRYRAMLKP